MKINIENSARAPGKRYLRWLAQLLAKNLKEMRDRLMQGDEAVIEEFFRIHVFDDDIEFARPLKSTEKSEKELEMKADSQSPWNKLSTKWPEPGTTFIALGITPVCQGVLFCYREEGMVFDGSNNMHIIRAKAPSEVKDFLEKHGFQYWMELPVLEVSKEFFNRAWPLIR